MRPHSQVHLDIISHRPTPKGHRQTFIVGKVVLHGADRKLLLEPVDLVEEQNNTGLDKPSRVANTVEKCEGLLHSVDGLIFEQ